MSAQLDMLAWIEAQAPAQDGPVLLHRIDPERNMKRYYRAQSVRSLFGECGVQRQWGRIGWRGQSLTEWHNAPEGASEAMRRIVSQKQRRDYGRVQY